VKRVTEAAERNKGPIADALAGVLPERGTVLELASGSGQHVMFFAQRFPALTFQPSDPSAEARASIAAHLAEVPLANVAAPIELDVTASGWHRPVDAILCINMVQVVPYSTIAKLFEGAARCLAAGAPLVLYGPYRRGDDFLSPGNEAFDRTLKERDATFGVRDMNDLRAHGERAGFAMEPPVGMPASNHLLVFRKLAQP
jgi:cyclopropane fatty-acyl-phospholipid synthase-like methyltransferase